MFSVIVSHKSSTSSKRHREGNYCTVCNTSMTQLPRHLERLHSELPEVAEILSKRGKERQLGLLKLRNMGNFKHNISVLESGSGVLRVSRRSGKIPKSADDYLPCVHCFAFYCKDQLWRHVASCPLNKNTLSEEKHVAENHHRMTCCAAGQLLLEGSLIKKDSNVFDPEFKRAIIDKMHKDGIRLAAISDEIIVSFGQVLFKRLGPHRSVDIQQRMRQIARLLQTINASRNSSDAYKLADLLTGSKFDVIVAGVHQLAGLSVHSTGRRIYSRPSLACKLGHSLKKCAQMKVGIGIKDGDVMMQKDASDFLFLHNADWQDNVSTVCTASFKLSKVNRVTELPEREDLDKLKEYQNKEMKLCMEKMKECPNYETWRHLSEITLSRVTLFNKRRGGEAAQLLVSQYVNRPNWQEQANSEVVLSLKPVERELLKRMDMVQIPGKRLNNVPLLLTAEVKAAMDILVKNRSAVGIPDSNLYFFPSYSKHGHLDPCQVIKRVVKLAGVKHPGRITTTKLRKYIATMMQLFDLTQTEFDWVSNHLGHSLNIHKLYYRQHTAAIEMGKVGRLLLQVEEGQSCDYNGRTLEDIALDGNIFY